MMDVIDSVDTYLTKNPSAQVVLFMDIDNTLLKMKDNFGSDQWFRWQVRQMRDTGVARDLRHLQRIINVIYQVHPCEPCEPEIPIKLSNLVDKWGASLRLVFITARAHMMYDTSMTQLKRIMGDHIAFDIITCEGQTKAHFAKYYLDAHPQIRAFFFVDDSFEHFHPFTCVQEFAEMHMALFHYTHQYPEVASFETGNKAMYVDYFNTFALTGVFDGL